VITSDRLAVGTHGLIDIAREERLVVLMQDTIGSIQRLTRLGAKLEQLQEKYREISLITN
jgi:hypothetical protein